MGFVTNIDFTSEDDREALQQCFRNGWLHSDTDATSFDCADILELVINVISIFSPRIFSTLQDIGAGGVQPLLEAQYQDEFHGCCHTYSKSSLVSFAEFGMAKGRVDFYIPAKKWGVELLRDGNQLAQHSRRFSSQTGAYGTTLPLSD